MNRDQNFVAFLGFFIFWVGIDPTTADAESKYKFEFDEKIATEIGGNATLLCNPSLRENSTLSSLASNFEWELTMLDFEKVPIFSNGKLAAFLFEEDADDSSFAIDNNPPATLILRKILFKDSLFTCTFSTPETKVSYTYYLQVNGSRTGPGQFRSRQWIGLKDHGHRVQLNNCDVLWTTLSSGYYWLSRKSKPGEDIEDVKVISLNRSVVLKNSTQGFQVAENGSLIIDNLSPVWETTFECHVSNGHAVVYSLELDYYNESTTESRDWAITNQTKQNITVAYGTRNIVLPCPLKYNITNSSYIWTFSDPASFYSLDLLFVDQKKIAYGAKPSPDFYEINDDGSLVILAVKKYQYGRYVCQRSTGEQFIYNLNRGSKTISETISIKGKNTVTLPCPLEDQVDRDYNTISWDYKSKDNEYYPSIYVLNGAIMKNRNEILGKAKLADDKTSLIVLNLTSSSIGEEYYCDLIYSKNRYEYRLID